MVKVTNLSSDNSVGVSCVSSKVNGYQHQDKHPRLMSSFAKPSSSCSMHNEFNSLQSTSTKSFSECDNTDKSKFFDRFPKKDAVMYAKSPPVSPDRQQHASNAVNGVCKVKYSPGSPKWTENLRNRTGYSSPEQSPSKNFDSENSISKRKAQPILYRKMFGVFKENDEVLARWSDGLYYLGIVHQVISLYITTYHI